MLNPAHRNQKQSQRSLASVWTRLASALVLLAACAGCGTAGIEHISTTGPGWKVQEGQAVWRPDRNRPELSGDMVVAICSDNSYVFDFSKTPLPVVHGQTTATNWLIEFPAAKLGFGGRNQPPTRFTWLYLQKALSGQPLPKRFQFTRNSEGSWRLENTRTGEFIEGYLAPSLSGPTK